MHPGAKPDLSSQAGRAAPRAKSRGTNNSGHPRAAAVEDAFVNHTIPNA